MCAFVPVCGGKNLLVSSRAKSCVHSVYFDFGVKIRLHTRFRLGLGGRLL